MLRRRAYHQQVVAPRPHFQQRVRHRAFDATDVEAVIEHASGDRFGVRHTQANRHLRMRAHKGTEQLADPVISHRIARTDAQLAAQRRALLAATAAEFGVPLQQLLRQRQQFAAARVQPQAAAFAREHRCIELPLHLRQRHAGRGLGQVQPLGGGAHAAVQRNLHEHIELARTDIDHQPILSA